METQLVVLGGGPGGYSGYFADPDGHLWEVAWNPFWTVDEEGNVRLR